MTRRANRLAVLALAAVSLTLYHGCSQTDDIVTPVSTTILTLESRLLPATPANMAYELWVARDGDTASIGKFRYDRANLRYLTEAGLGRPDGNRFSFGGDVLSYGVIFLSVETSPDPAPASPANIMLLDNVTHPNQDPLDLVFPLSDSLWFSTCQFSMESPSDGDRLTNDGSGIWFAQYQVLSDSTVDTISLDSVVFDTQVFERDTAYIANWVATGVETVGLAFTFDTIQHIRVVYDYIVDSVTNPPETVLVASPAWSFGDTLRYELDHFTQGAEGYGLVDYSDYGFRYRAWVVSPAITAAGASVGQFTPPAWNHIATNALPGWQGGMISTGTFATAGVPAETHPYAAGPRVPPYPGEDFMTNLPNGAPGPLNLLPNPTGNIGSVFITLEPTNYTDVTTNFPLIAYLAQLPTSQAQLPPTSVGGVTTQFFTMRQNTGTASSTDGFPRIRISLDRR